MASHNDAVEHLLKSELKGRDDFILEGKDINHAVILDARMGNDIQILVSGYGSSKKILLTDDKLIEVIKSHNYLVRKKRTRYFAEKIEPGSKGGK